MRKAGLLLLVSAAACSGPAANPQSPATPSATASSDAAEPARSALPETSPKRLQALGTEPFWSVEDRGGIVRYSTPDYVNWTPIAIVRQDEGERKTFTGMYRGLPFVLIVAPGPCSDGMSDTVYAMTAALTVRGEQRHGCARLK